MMLILVEQFEYGLNTFLAMVEVNCEPSFHEWMLAQKPEMTQFRNNFVTKMYIAPDAVLCRHSALSHPDSPFALVFALN